MCEALEQAFLAKKNTTTTRGGYSKINLLPGEGKTHPADA